MEKKDLRKRGRRRRRAQGIRSLIFLMMTVSVLALVCFLAVRGTAREVFRRDNSSVELSWRETAVSGGKSEEEQADSWQDMPWYLMLVNRWNPIPQDYQAELADVPGGEQVDARILQPLAEMMEAAEQEGLGPVVVSGYRTQKKQQRLYDDKVRAYRGEGYDKEEARELAGQWVSLPGTSEHQLGLAVDINGDTYDLYLWLQENSWRYGFIFRYPGNKTDITGVAEEVWHYRYVGKEAAEEIYQQGLCLEEYLERLEKAAA